MKFGDIYWVRFPGGAGHAQAGRRPAIVLQSEAASTQLPTVLMVPLTSRLDASRFPGTLLVEKDLENNLRRSSVALVFQLTAVDRSFLDGVVGHVSPPALQALRTALDQIIERPA